MLYPNKQAHLNTWLLGLNPPSGAFAHITNNGSPVFVTATRILSGSKLCLSSIENLTLPKNISIIICPENIDEQTKTIWAKIISVAPEFAPDGDDEKKQFQALEGRQVWIKFA